MLSLFLLVYTPWGVKIFWQEGRLQISIIIIIGQHKHAPVETH